MLRTRLLQVSLFLAFAVGAVAAASALPAAGDPPYDIASLPRAQALRLLSLGHPTLAANLYWLRAVQYVGEPRANARGWDRLYPTVDLVTDLDPKHGYAYQVAGTILGSVGRIEESNAILEKGMRNVPDRYILPYFRAFNAFYYQGDYALAGDYVERAARIPGAPPHLRQNVLAMYVKGRRADAAIAFLREALAEARDDDSRKAIAKQLDQAILEQAAQPIDEAITAYRARWGFSPPALPFLVADGLLGRIPVDPEGGTFYLGDDGRAHSSVDPYRFALPETKQHAHPEPVFDPGKLRQQEGL